VTVAKTHQYYLDGEKHLSEQARLTGAQLMARSHLPLRGKFLLKIGNPDEALNEKSIVVLLDKPAYFLTRPLVDVAAIYTLQALRND
jgi:hypothetical protein